MLAVANVKVTAVQLTSSKMHHHRQDMPKGTCQHFLLVQTPDFRSESVANIFAQSFEELSKRCRESLIG